MRPAAGLDGRTDVSDREPAGSRTIAPGSIGPSVLAGTPSASAIAIRSGPPCDTTTASRSASRSASHADSTRSARLAAVSPPGQSIAASPSASARARSGAIRSSSANVRPSAIPMSASDQRGSISTGPRPAAAAIAVAVWSARRDGLLTIRVPRSRRGRELLGRARRRRLARPG